MNATNTMAQALIVNNNGMHVLYGHAGQPIDTAPAPFSLFRLANKMGLHLVNEQSPKGQAILAKARAR